MKRRLNEAFIVFFIGLVPVFVFWDELDRITGGGMVSLLVLLAYAVLLRVVAEKIAERIRRGQHSESSE